MTDDPPRRPSRWAHRAAPFAWERKLMWLLIAACLGPDIAARASPEAAAALVSSAFHAWRP